jgi:hypothetical protein
MGKYMIVTNWLTQWWYAHGGGDITNIYTTQYVIDKIVAERNPNDMWNSTWNNCIRSGFISVSNNLVEPLSAIAVSQDWADIEDVVD